MAAIEIRLALDGARVAELIGHPALLALRRGRPRTERLRIVYFDTPERRIARAGLGLRSRRRGRRWTVSVESDSPQTPAPGVKAAIEWVSTGSAPDPLRLVATPWRALFVKALREGPLGPVCTADVERISFPVDLDGRTFATLAVDRGYLAAARGTAGAGRREPVCEVDIGIAAGDPTGLFDLAALLVDELGCMPEPRSRAERGYALADAVVEAPSRARDASFGPEATAREAATAILAECVRQIRSNAVGFPAGRDPEWVHQLRIGLRRLRSCLSIFGDLFASGRVESLAAEIRWALDTLGAARDLDVFATSTLPRALPDLALARAGRAGVDWDPDALARRLAARCRLARREVDAAVASPRFATLVLDALALARVPTSDEARVAAGRESARAFCARAIERRARRLARAGARLALAGDEERHAVRLAAKKLRYATEFAAPLFPGRRTRESRAALARLQETLGEFNDLVVAPRVAAALAGPGSPATATIDAWARGRAGALAETIDDAWRHYRSSRPFWPRPRRSDARR
ncbi:MAG: CHAD domain-containing protein [Burkholderiales bacterium]